MLGSVVGLIETQPQAEMLQHAGVQFKGASLFAESPSVGSVTGLLVPTG